MNTNAYTLSYAERVDSIYSVCSVSDCCEPDKVLTMPMYDCCAIWDTGAVATVISKKLVKELNLHTDGRAIMVHADGQSQVYTYTVNLKLPNGIVIQGLHVSAADLVDTEILIGMDIISLCDFAISLPQGKTKFSFQIPSVRDIDFTKTTI